MVPVPNEEGVAFLSPHESKNEGFMLYRWGVFALVYLSCLLYQVVHGDLTTSNLMVRNGTQRVVAIDFGLASQQPLPEDKVSDQYDSTTSSMVVKNNYQVHQPDGLLASRDRSSPTGNSF